MRSQLVTQFADRYFPAATPPAKLPTVAAATAKHDAAVMAGTYWASRRAEGTWIELFYLPGQTHGEGVLPDGEIVVKGAGPRPGRSCVRSGPSSGRKSPAITTCSQPS